MVDDTNNKKELEILITFAPIRYIYTYNKVRPSLKLWFEGAKHAKSPGGEVVQTDQLLNPASIYAAWGNTLEM